MAVSLVHAALQRALDERRIYREYLLAALDQLHLAQRRIEQQQQQIIDLHGELRERMGVPTNGDLR